MNLDEAIRAGDLSLAAEALRSGAEVNHRNPDGLTPLMIGAGRGQAQMVDLLLTAGADVLAIEPRMGATALHKASQSGNPDVIALLLDHGAFIDQQSPVLGHTALMDAVLHKHETAVRLLLERGARLKIKNHWQQTAHELAKQDKLQVITQLIEERDRVDVECIQSKALATAAKAGDRAELERLIASDADVNERMPITGGLDDDYTPLGIAVREGHVDIVRVLLENGADPRRVIGLMRGTPVHEAAFLGNAELIDLIVETSGNGRVPAPELDAQGPYNGLTALHDAVWHGHFDAARTLAKAGARLDLETHAGLTPRQLALLYGYNEIACFLAEAK
jgi:ankyrin repeat protein